MTPTREGHAIFEGLKDWKVKAPLQLEGVYRDVLSQFSNSQPTVYYLGVGSKAIYTAIRHDVGVPFHQGFVEHPLAGIDVLPQMLNGREKKTVGG
ncbi:phenylalanine ammonia-lyase [Penicillium lividum]|nr:phenylalanine ammonia-lyase [Penicillium lividum]